MKKILVMTVFGMLVFCSWTFLQEREIKKAEWLIGTWENKTPKGSVYETWTKVNEVEFAAKSYMLHEKDSVIFETIRLLQVYDTLFYIPTVKNQNGGMPVRFALKTVSDNSLEFENSFHDFPQIISYTKIHSDSLVAEISGTKNGKDCKLKFPMKRVK